MRKLTLLIYILFGLGIAFSTSAARVDLSITATDITVSPEPPTNTSNIVLTVTVHNNGAKSSRASSVVVKLIKDGKRIYQEDESIPSIASGGTTQVIFSLGSGFLGNYTIVAKADPEKKIAESNEKNNKATTSMTVVTSSSGDGQTAAAVYGMTFSTTSSMMDMSNMGMGCMAGMDMSNMGMGGMAGMDMSNMGMGGMAGMSAGLLPKGWDGIVSRNRLLSRMFGGRGETTYNCSKAGTVDLSIDLDTHSRPSKVTMVFSGCEEWIDEDDGIYSSASGNFSVDITYVSDNPLDPDFMSIASMVMKAGDGDPSSDILPDLNFDVWDDSQHIMAESSDFTMAIDVLSYDTNNMPSHMVYTANGVDVVTDFTTGITLTSTLTDYSIDASYTGTEGDMTVNAIINGSASITNSYNPDWNFSITYNNLTYVLHSTMMMQAELTVDGSVNVTSACVSGTFIFDTIEPIVFSNMDECPTAGRISITGPSGNATIIFNSDGSVDIDENSDGSIDKSYSSCEEVDKEPCGS